MAREGSPPSTNVIHVDFGRGVRAPKAPEAPPPAEPILAPTLDSEPPDAELDAARAERAGAAPHALATKKRDPTGDLYARAEVSRLFGIPESRLRYWDRTGFLTMSGEVEGKRFYTFQDLIGLRAAKTLLQQGTPLQRVRNAVESLKGSLPHVIRPLAELRISADGDRLLVHTERAKWEPSSGQLVLDFDVRDLRDEVVRVLRPDAQDPARRRAAYEAYLEGARYDEEPATFDRAEAAYRRAISLDPTLGHAFTNLGNLRFRRGDEVESETLYRRALAIDPEQPEAYYNLGYLASERGEHEEALRCFEAAVRSDPAFADAHFNLAMTLQTLHGIERARPHWETYLKLEPNGEWAEIALRHIRG